MSDKETIQQMRNLYREAENYAWAACGHLVLETSVENGTTLGPEVLERIPGLFSGHGPNRYTASLYLDKFIIHYLFPNLSDDERRTIEKAYDETTSVIAFRRDGIVDDEKLSSGALKKHVDAINGFESKLTVVQMALLDSRFCNPDSSIDYEE